MHEGEAHYFRISILRDFLSFSCNYFEADLWYLNIQGDSADCMYFIEDGEVRIAMRQMVGFTLHIIHCMCLRK